MSLRKIALICSWVLSTCHLTAIAADPTTAWPQHPVTIIVPFSASGGTDAYARLLTAELSAVIGQTVLIDNVAGAGGAIGTRKLAQAVPDGHVLMYGGISETVLIPQNNQTAGYKPQDLQALFIIGSSPMVLAARKDISARSLDAMVKLARSSPMKYTYGSSGVGSSGHLMFEAFARKQGIQLLHVPYKGSSQLLTDMASGQIDLTLTNLTAVLPFAKARRVNLLGISTPQLLPDWPDLPTFSESSALAQESISIWGGVFAPRGLAPETAQKINAAFTQTLKNEALRAKLGQLGIKLEKPRSHRESETFYEQQVRLYQPLATGPEQAGRSIAVK